MMHPAGFPITPDDVIERLYTLLSVAIHVCEQEKITYWATGGTLLGIVRHGEIIPWDDDCDIGIYETDEQTMFTALQSYLLSMPECGIKAKCNEYGIKMECMNMKGVGLDVFTYTAVGSDGIARLSKPAAIYWWPQDVFYGEELKHFTTKQFGPLPAVCMVTEPMRYLHTMYGKDCMEVAEVGYYCHLEGDRHVNAGLRANLK